MNVRRNFEAASLVGWRQDLSSVRPVWLKVKVLSQDFPDLPTMADLKWALGFMVK